MLAEIVGVSDPGLLTAPELDGAEGRVVGADEVPLGRAGIEVVDAARRLGTGAGARRQVGERGDDDRPGAEDRGLLDDVAVGADEGAGADEDVAADVERVDVDAERGIVAEVRAGSAWNWKKVQTVEPVIVPLLAASLTATIQRLAPSSCRWRWCRARR